MTPREIDTQLAEVWTQLYRARDRAVLNGMDLQRLAGAQFGYQGKRRVAIGMSVDEARDIVRAEVERMQEHAREHEGEPGLWLGWDGPIATYDRSRAESALDSDFEIHDEIHRLRTRANELEDLYTGWSRFFLVTSSAGHVHSSMHCSTCRPETRFGWLPELSGQSEAEAVKDLGPTLCTVCFPTAPVKWTEGKKLTKAQAERKVSASTKGGS